MHSKRQLWTGFIESCNRFPERPAIDVGREVTYQELAQRARRIAATIQTGLTNCEVPLTAVFAYRSETAYAGVLGALMAGHGYVPLNRTFPVDRTRVMLERSRCRSIVVDAGSEPQLDALLAGVDTELLLLCPDRSDVTELAAKFPTHRVVERRDGVARKRAALRRLRDEALWLYEQRSGLTNVRPYVRFVSTRYVCLLAKRGMCVLSHTETINQAGRIHE